MQTPPYFFCSYKWSEESKRVELVDEMEFEVDEPRGVTAWKGVSGRLDRV